MESTARQTYLDWLRIFSIMAVLLFHSAMPYVAEWGWHIKNKETSNLMLEFNYFLHLFRMPLLFFISGTVSYFMMQRRSSTNFIALRFRRLLIPLLVGMLFIVPPQIYIERLNAGYTGHYASFYPTVWDFVPYPEGSLSWHHLWFIAYLFIYDILFAPLFAWLASSNSDGFKNGLKTLAKGKRVYLMALPSIIWYSLLRQKYPQTNMLVDDYCYFIYWLLFLLAGFLCIVQPRLMDSLERNRRFALSIGFLCLLLLNYLRWNKIEPGYVSWPFQNILFSHLYSALAPLVAWGWVLALVGYGKRYLNSKHPVLDYLNQAVYPFYILHQTVIVVLTYYIIQIEHESILAKYSFTVGISLFISFGIYHLLIKPYALVRFLFGMKPKHTKKVGAIPAIKNNDPTLSLPV